VSCDLYTGSFVANESKERITVTIKYNKNNEEIKGYKQIHKGFENFVKFIQNYRGSKVSLIATDASKYTATFKLNQKDTLEIWGGLHQSNNFDEIEEVMTYSNNLKTTIKGEDIQNVFSEKRRGIYIYTIE
jgi:hypothetical protein